ncbi:hypothetical protein GLYMA_13G208251v4 [Glycine max]|nr:hypothetical protein GLYMA_13G208251v4 [Glycine max]
MESSTTHFLLLTIYLLFISFLSQSHATTPKPRHFIPLAKTQKPIYSTLPSP